MEKSLSNGKKRFRAKKKSANKKAKQEPSLPLSKRQELNNYIVCMRNGVKQAKVQTIGRLVHQVQKYKNRKGGGKELEKAQRKVQRLLEEIQILKKIKKDKVSLYSLLDTQKLDTVLNNPQSLPEERVLSRLSHHNVIVSHVQKYRNANPNWDKQIPVLLEMTREKRGKKKAKVDSSTPPANKKTLLIKNTSKLEELERVDDNGGSLGDGSNSDVDEEQDNIPDSDFDEHIGEEEEDDGDDRQEKELEEPAVLKPTKQKLLNSTKPEKRTDKTRVNSDSVQPTIPTLNKLEGSVKVKFLTDLKDLEDDNVELADNTATIDITQTKPSKRPKSAFFVGGVDEPESETEIRQERKPFQKPHHQNGNSKPVYKKGKLISKPSLHVRNNPIATRPFGGGRSDNRFGGNTEPVGVNKPNFSSERNKLLQPPIYHKPEATTAPEKLHPSWEAKKRQQQISLTEFKGKKIVFGDDD